MEDSPSLSTGAIFGIVSGCLGLATFVVIFILWARNKRKLGSTNKAEFGASLRYDQKRSVSRPVGEVNLLRMQTEQHGYSGGMSQSRLISPTPSCFLAPGKPVVDWSTSGTLAEQSPSRSAKSLPKSLALSGVNHTKSKPSLLGLQPPTGDPLNSGNIGGPDLPPSHSLYAFNGISSPLSALDEGESPRSPDWVSPLGAQYSRPSTTRITRPNSSVPRIQFLGDTEKRGMLAPKPTNPVGQIRSDSASIVSTATPMATSRSVLQPSYGARSPRLSVFPPISLYSPSRALRDDSRSILPANNNQNRQPSRSGLAAWKNSNQSVLLDDLSPRIDSTKRVCFPQDTGQWSSSSTAQFLPHSAIWIPTAATFRGPLRCNDDGLSRAPVTCDSAINVQRVSAFQPSHVLNTSASALETKNSRISVASSMYSTRTCNIDYERDAPTPHGSRSRSRSTSAVPRVESRSHPTFMPSTGARLPSSKSIIQIHNSVRQHSRKPSSASTKNRRSRYYDQMECNPAAIQARSFDSTYPRESPSSNTNEVLHSPKYPLSTTFSRRGGYFDPTGAIETPTIPQMPPASSQSDLTVSDQKLGRLWRGSSTSQVSISDFYDAYYRQSVLEQIPSTASLTAETNLQGSYDLIVNAGVQSVDGPVSKKQGAKRPAPLRLDDTIMEVVSPFPSPLLTKQSYTNMI